MAPGSYREPMDDDEHRARQDSQWRSVVRDVEKALGKDGDKTDATQRGIVQLLRDNDIAAVRRVGYTDRLRRYAGCAGVRLSVPRSEGPRELLLQALVADEPRPPNVTQALIEKQFAAFREREPRMPPASPRRGSARSSRVANSARGLVRLHSEPNMMRRPDDAMTFIALHCANWRSCR